MQYNDDKLVQLTLKGDHDAFAVLVEKYQSQIHALAWQQIGDFHIAEDITQEAFLTAHQKLATLTHPDRFANWLYAVECYIDLANTPTYVAILRKGLRT